MRVLLGMAASPRRDDLVARLEALGVELSVAADGSAVRMAAAGVRPDAALVDHELEGGGLDAACRVRSIGEAVVMVIGVPTVEQRLEGFDRGLDDCVASGTDVREILARLDAVLRRVDRKRSRVVQVGDLVYDEDARTVQRDGEVVDLTRTEFDLLGALARDRGRVVAVRSLVDQVWPDGDADAPLVQTHISALRRKLEHAGPRVIHTVRGVGYVMRPASGADDGGRLHGS